MAENAMNQLDILSKAIWLPYDDHDERDIKVKVEDIEYLEKVKEDVYLFFAKSRSKKYGKSVEEYVEFYKKLYDLKFDSEDDDIEFQMTLLKKMSKDSGDVFQRLRAVLIDKIEKVLDPRYALCDNFLSIVDDPVQVSDEFALMPFKEITKDHIREEVKNNFEYYRPRIMRKEFSKIDADPDVKSEQEKTASQFNVSHTLTQLAQEFKEERAREEVEIMRQNRHQKSSHVR